MKDYRHDIDTLKGLSIIAVVLFHLGIVKSGYLGVDAFFVINGFFLIPSMFRDIIGKRFSYLLFLEKRVIRLLPCILIASFVCLVIGYLGMLPDDYENLSQSVVASNLLSQNVLSYFTVSDYWNAVNDYKPLMHLWYVGILAEFYIVLPLLLIAARTISDKIQIDRKKTLLVTLALLALISFVLYIGPWLSDGAKFYLLPCRLFELILGGLLALLLGNMSFSKESLRKSIKYVILFVLTVTVFSSLFKFNISSIGNPPTIVGADKPIDDGLVLNKTILLLLTVICTVLFVNIGGVNIKSRFLEWFGRRSYSIFIWHQVILAFMRYYVTTDITIASLLAFMILTVIVSEVSYQFVERKVTISIKNLLICCSAAVICIILSGCIYLKAGVVRDVPELEIKKGEGKRGMFSEYCDRIYKYNNDFTKDNGKLNVLVEGISYGRDFCNVLLESEYKDSINVSYIEKWENTDYTDRIKKADIIFTFRNKSKVPNYVWENARTTKIIGLGPKAFGINNGQIYSCRKSKNYFNLTAEAFPECLSLNNKWGNEWGNNYVDFMEHVVVNGDRVKVFTPDHKFISQDCRHFTPAGAKWYASVLELDRFFEK